MKPTVSIIPSREAVTLDPQRCFSEKQKAAIFKRAGGRCEVGDCRKKIRGKWTAGHILAWSLGGPTTIENGRVECPDCSPITHGEDTATAAKAERQGLRKGQQARRKNGSKLKSRNDLGGEAYAARKQWAERVRER